MPTSSPSPLRAHGLPQELIDVIIDHLHSDKEALESCSLVCRAWVPSSSIHLLRCVAWPLQAHSTPGCNYFDLLWTSQEQTCTCPDALEAAFSACVSALKSSPRLQCHVRELHLSSERQECFMRPGQSAEREKLPISTLFDVLNLLPNIHGLHLERCALCILSDPHDHQQHPPLVFPKRAVYDLQTLTFHGIIGKTAIQAITVLLSRFKYIGSLTFAGIHTTRWPLDSPLSFLFPLDGLAIESLTLEHQSMDPDSEVDGSEEVMQVLCHELQAHADLGALRELVVDVLTTELLDLASAAPHLEHINCVATSTAPPVDSARHRVALRRLTLVVPVLLRGDLGLYGASPLADLAAHLRALAVFGAAEIAICVHLCMLPSEPGEDELDVDVAVQFTLNMLEPEWHEVGEALGYYASLRMLTLEVRNMTYMPDQAYDTLLGAAAAHNLPVKYADMLRLV